MSKIDDTLRSAASASLQEIFPQLQNDIIVRILTANKWNVERSCEACFAFIKSLEAERAASAETTTVNDASISTSNPGQSGTSPVKNSKPSSVEKFSSQAYNPNDPRGKTILMPPSFLSPPKFRLSVDRCSDVCVDFTVLFNRTNAILGVVIGTSSPDQHSSSIDSEICVRDLTERSLAKESGIRVGDVVTGVENVMFPPGAEIQDVLDAVRKCGNFVQLHLRRHMVGKQRKRVAFLGDTSAAMEAASYHPFACLLMEQKLIGEDRAQKVTESVAHLKARVLQWDTGELQERVRSGLLQAQVESNSLPTGRNSISSRISVTLNRKRRTSIEQNLDATFVTPLSYSSLLSDATGAAGSSSSSGAAGDGSSPRSAASGSGGEPYSSESAKLVGSRGAAGPEDDKNAMTDSVPIKVPTRNLRPALATRILRAEVRDDHIVYVILVIDVKSGAEWTVRRRFSEFHLFRERLICIRPSIKFIEFPPKRLSSDTAGVNERLRMLQRFLRKACSLLLVNSLHESTASVHQALQDFLLVHLKLDAIRVLDEEHSEHFGINSSVQVYVHSIMQMSFLDKVYEGIQESCGASSSASLGFSDKFTEERALDLLEKFKDFLDNLVEVMYKGVLDDSYRIVKHCQGEVHKTWRESSGGGFSRAAASASASERANSIRTPTREIHTGGILATSKSSTSASDGTSADSAEDNFSLSPAQFDLPLSVSAVVGQRNSKNPSHISFGEVEDVDELTALRHATNLQVKLTSDLSDDEIHDLIRRAVRRQVEIELFIACSSHLTRALESGLEAAEAILTRNIDSLYSNPQTFYGICIKHVSPTSWERIVAMFRRLPLYTLPQDRIKHLIATAKEIPAVYAEEHLGAREPLGADDILPIFIYVIVQARVPCLLALNAAMQSLVDPEKRRGEDGYYLATLEAAIEHVREVDQKSGQSALLIHVVSGASRGRGDSDHGTEKQWIQALDHAGISFDQDDTETDDSDDASEEEGDGDGAADGGKGSSKSSNRK
jgi:hypothetical protein